MRKRHAPAPERDPHLSAAIERNIEALSQMHEKTETLRSAPDRIADAITQFSGSLYFLYVHVVWFGLWIALNSGHLGVHPFDPFPYGLLTMVVSLEAIFLSTFVLISQNRLSAEADRRADLALQIGLFTEHEITRVLKMLDAIQDKMGIENDSDQELLELEKEVLPEDVLTAIARVQQRVHEQR